MIPFIIFTAAFIAFGFFARQAQYESEHNKGPFSNPPVFEERFMIGGTIEYSDGTIVRPDGYRRAPDGTITDPQGNTITLDQVPPRQ